MDAVSDFLGLPKIVEAIEEILGDSKVKLVRLTGPPGSAKSTIAKQVAANWKTAGGASILAIGDNLNIGRPYFPFLAGLIEVRANWGKLALQGSRSAFKVLDVLHGTGGIASNLFDMMSSTRGQKAERASRILSQLERDILSDLRRFCRSKQLLLIADNAHWWDAGSLAFLEQLRSTFLGQVFPELDSMRVLLVDSFPAQDAINDAAFGRLCKEAAGTYHTRLCEPAFYGPLLEAFGVSCALSVELVRQLYTITGGHLKLTEQLAKYIIERGPAQVLMQSDAVDALLTKRIDALGQHEAEPIENCLSMASIMGLSFDIRELACATGQPEHNVKLLLEKAQKLAFVDDVTGHPRFSHDVLRSYFLGRQSGLQVHESKRKLEQCVAKLRPGDYELRAKLLIEAGEHSSARDLFALSIAKRLREGQLVRRVLADVEETFPNDEALLLWARTISAIYQAIGNAEHAHGHRIAAVPVDNESLVMGAERNYAGALCAMELQTHDDFSESIRILETWCVKPTIPWEIRLRLQLALQQAYVLAGEFDRARTLEVQIESLLLERSNFDQDARDLLQIQNRRAASVCVPEIAEIRVRRSVAYFSTKFETIRRPVEYYRALTNHVGILIQLGRNDEAYQTAKAAENLLLHNNSTEFPRKDVLGHNLVLATLRNSNISASQAVEQQRRIVHSPDGEGDNFLQRCNLVAYHLLDGDVENATTLIVDLGKELERQQIDESYLLYYARSLEVAVFCLSGDRVQAIRRHDALTDFVNGLKWPTAPYLKRRHVLWAAELERMDSGIAIAPLTLDILAIKQHPTEIGPCWNHYGRLIPCVELAFWSDS